MIAEKCPEAQANVDDCGFGYGFATFQNPSWRLDDLIKGSGGTLLSGFAHGGFRAVSTDSRLVSLGDIFVALHGDNFDGCSFIRGAIKKGAAAIITDRAPEKVVPVPCILVDDTMQALGNLARYRRDKMENLQVLAVTGSSGKTTVKEMAALLLSQRGKVLKTKGNFNNRIGLPLSLLPVNYRHDFAVLEMGMNRPGEIAALAEIAKPDVACILNIQDAHLEGLGSIDAIAQAKGELFSACDESTTLIFNLDDMRVTALTAEKLNSKISFGCKKGAFVRATRIYNRGEKGMSYTLHIGEDKARVALNVCGNHNVSNSLAAAAMAHSAGLSITEIVQGLTCFCSAENRFTLEEGVHGLKIINDTYNANPASMRAAVVTLSSMRKEGKIAAIFGDMLELGDSSVKAHGEIGKVVAASAFDYLLAVGKYAENMVEAARSAGMGEARAKAFSSKEVLAEYLRELVRKNHLSSGDFLLFKGSRGMQMEEVLKGITTAEQ